MFKPEALPDLHSMLQAALTPDSRIFTACEPVPPRNAHLTALQLVLLGKGRAQALGDVGTWSRTQPR